jgi:hypothetical protein
LINEKISKKLKGSGNPNVKKTCIECEKEFEVNWQYRDQKTCSKKCSSIINWKNKEYREKTTNSIIKNIILGNKKGTKRAIRCQYLFNNKIIRCDSKTEYSCLDYFEKNFNVEDIKRCNIVIPYLMDGKIRNYLPDFIVKTKMDTYIIECKAFFKITDEVKNSKSWNMYYNSIIPKKEALEKFSLINGFKSFFYTRDLNRKFYDNLRITS